jgi:hypothetical protein
LTVWAYRDYSGRIIALNPNDMSGNTGWEEVPDDTVPDGGDPPGAEPEPTPQAQWRTDVENALVELAGLIAGGE